MTNWLNEDLAGLPAVPLSYRVWRGRPSPLGATWDGAGVNFAVASEHATGVLVCLFDSAQAHHEVARVPLREHTDGVWHGYIPGLSPGQLYGLRVRGPWEPHAGHRFNLRKIVLDPWARAIGRGIGWSDAMFGYRVGDDDLTRDDRDNAWCAPLAVVTYSQFDWGDDRPLRTPWHKTLIYETHVKGQTRLHPQVPEPIRGTYAGLASRASIEHLQRLGVTAVELLPVHAHVDDRNLVTHGLRNYWGYNTLSYFAPEPSLSSAACPAGVLTEFKSMVKRLHEAGIEVILDVVYNHTGEGNERGPTLSLRGIDNSVYYRLMPGSRRYYQDFTGCGNTLNMQSPRVLQLIMDSLRYWVQEMHVDGFRFDLASALARELHDVDKLSAFFDIILQDPVLSQVKLIAEPWDLGSGGYQVGNFPQLWSEWNGRYRDTLRRFWAGDRWLMSEVATRLSGSSDLYQPGGRSPRSSINFITAHDGFTLRDLVTWEHKRNAANLEDNRDGESHNNNWNCGVEGETADPAIQALRLRQRRNLLATLLLSQGVPMLRGGDELSMTQGGNNNPYCQDNEISWLRWDLSPEEQQFLDFCRRLTAFWRSHPVLQRSRFFRARWETTSAAQQPLHIDQVVWLDQDGVEVLSDRWHSGQLKALGMRLNGDSTGEEDDYGEPIYGETLLAILNPQDEPVHFQLTVPAGAATTERWRLELDTFTGTAGDTWESGTACVVRERSVCVLIRERIADSISKAPSV